jgi:MFS-type transporter involved in bile tolerance (Atg22 family)
MSVTISGLFTMILTQILGDQVDQEQIANFINVGGLIISAVVIWWGRYRKGDITWYGVKK